MDHLARASKGGLARAAAMSPEERSESARKAVTARWAKRRRQLQSWTHNAAAFFTISNSESYTL